MQDWACLCGELLMTLRRNLKRAQQRMRESANKHRRHVEFEVGDLVLLKLQPYRQHSVARPLSAKLARRYYGPFEVIQRIGPVAYKLRLPEGCRIHNVFHVSLLREFVAGDDTGIVTDLPPEFMGDRLVVRPMSVLDRRTVWHEGRPSEHVLVQWVDGTDAPSWEPLDSVAQHFPDLLLVDKEVSNGEGVDTITSPTATPQATQGVVDQSDDDRSDNDAAQQVEQMPITKEPTPLQSMKGGGRPRRSVKPPARYGDFVAK